MDSRQGLSRQKLRRTTVAPRDSALYRGSVVGGSYPGESEGVVQSRGLYGGRAALVSSHGSGPRRSRRTTDHVGEFGGQTPNSVVQEFGVCPRIPRNKIPAIQSKSVHL